MTKVAAIVTPDGVGPGNLDTTLVARAGGCTSGRAGIVVNTQTLAGVQKDAAFYLAVP